MAVRPGDGPALPDEPAFGATLGEWLARQAQWQLSFPAAINAVMFAPLSPGEHTLQFSFELPDGTPAGVSYQLTVAEPVVMAPAVGTPETGTPVP